MSWSRNRALLAHNGRLLLADPAPIVLTTLMPIVLMAFLQGTGRAVLRASGYASASGAKAVVPGMAVLFALFGVGFIGTTVFSEHGWGTWERLRASSARDLEIVLGTVLPSAALILGQLVVLFGVGVLIFGLQIGGSIAGLAIMMGATIGLVVALSMLFTAVLRTAGQLMAAVNLAALVLGGLGGAFAPVDALPDWAQTLAPASPAYWILSGFRAVVLDGGGVGATLGPAGVTLAFAVAAALLAIWRFRPAEQKVGDG